MFRVRSHNRATGSAAAATGSATFRTEVERDRDDGAPEASAAGVDV